jgi:hypothetical protein
MGKAKPATTAAAKASKASGTARSVRKVTCIQVAVTATATAAAKPSSRGKNTARAAAGDVDKKLKPTRKPNGIKGVTKESKANDPLRDSVLNSLHKSGMCKDAECRIIFAHQGIYVRGKLFAWVGHGTTLSVPGKKAAQREVLQAAGCVLDTQPSSHKYWVVPRRVMESPKELAALAIAYVNAGE